MTLTELRASIKKERPFVGVKPYSHNLIGITLGMIADQFGQAEAEMAKRDFRLDQCGWSLQASSGGRMTCACGHNYDEHGGDPAYPGAMACCIEDCDCIAFEREEEE